MLVVELRRRVYMTSSQLSLSQFDRALFPFMQEVGYIIAFVFDGISEVALIFLKTRS